LAAAVTDYPASLGAISALREELRGTGLPLSGDSLERVVLAGAAAVNESRIDSYPIHPSVRTRLREEFRFYSRPAGKEPFDAGGYFFTTGCKVVTLRRFPAGPMDWEISGVPRSLFLRMPKADLPRVALFVATRLRGLFPLFFMHVARRPKNRSLLIEKEVLRAYYRTARSLDSQPGIRGIMASAWFHDPSVPEPHLAFLNRLYLDGGGLITTTGPAGADAGFLEHNRQRKERLEAGEVPYKLGLALWPRREALEWAGRHPELEYD
jgi:hypothetical protein